MCKFNVISVTLLSISLALGASACSAPTDMTVNRPGDTTLDPNYPPGPYGYITGSTVADYKFSGKSPSDGNYAAAPMRDILLGEFHADPSLKLVLIEGSANWCYYCNQEAPVIEKLSTTYEGKGFRAVTVLAEGITQGTPSTPNDIQDWVDKHNFKKTAMAIDPAERLFQYAPASAFPLHILLNTKTMKIEWLCVGGIGACNTEAAVSDTLSTL